MTDIFRTADASHAAHKLGDSTISENLKITGCVSAMGEIHVDGEIKGDLSCGVLVLGESAKLEGNVIAEDVIVRGRLVGSIRALRVTLQAMSHVEADIYHQSLALEQGAFFEGRCCHSDDPVRLASATTVNGAASKPVEADPLAADAKDKPPHRLSRTLPVVQTA